MNLSHSDVFTMQMASAAGTVASAAGSVATQSWSVELLGVPISVVLAAVAGAGFVLSWLPVMPIGRAIGTVFFAAFAAMYGAPQVVKAWPVLDGGILLIALGIAAALQVLMPVLIEKRANIVDWIMARIPGGKGGGT